MTQDQLVDQFLELVREMKGETVTMPEDKKGAALNLSDDLAFDSLDLIDFIFQIEEKYGVDISAEELKEKGLLVIGNLAAYVESNTGASG